MVVTDGGARRNRTADIFNAIEALSQLSYDPDPFRRQPAFLSSPFGEGLRIAASARTAWSGCITAMAVFDKRYEPTRLRHYGFNVPRRWQDRRRSGR